VALVVDDLTAWLVALLADAGRKKLTMLVLGTDQQRALRHAAVAAVERTAEQLAPADGKQGERLAMVVGEVFREPTTDAAVARQATLLEALQAGIASKLAVLDDPDVTGTGQSSAELLGLPGGVLAEALAGHLIQEIMVRGSRGGPLVPLADQLNHDVTHLQGQRLEGMLAQLVGQVTALAPAAGVDAPRKPVRLSRPADAVRVRDAKPRQLGVHAAIQVEGIAGELPVYVPRDIDVKLRAVLATGGQRGCFVLLIGSSSVGKTRTMHEAVLAVLPDWWLVHPDPGNSDLAQALAAARFPRTVIWLDELQRYLRSGHGLTAGTARSLLQSGTVLAATMWPDEYGTRIVPPQPGQSDQNASAREVLELAEVFGLAGEFTPAEQARAQELAISDGRLGAALSVSDGGLTQVLAAGPQLVHRWEQAPPYAKAVITAAVDARRLGVTTPLPNDLLAQAVPGYLTQAQRAAAPADWLQHALAYATTPLHGAASALTPVAGEELMGQTEGYVAADYLQHGRRARRTACPPLTLWESCLTHLVNAGDLLAVGDAARDRFLLGLAERFYRAADSAPEAVERLSELISEQGRYVEAEQVLRAAIERDNPYAAVRLGCLLMDLDQASEAEQLLRVALAEGKHGARRALAILLERQERFEEAAAVLREGIAAQDPDSPQRLGFLLMRELHQPDEAERVLRAAMAARQPGVAVPLAFLLRDQGRYEEAEQTLRDGIAAGDPYARFRLAEQLQQLGRSDEAERTCRDGIAAGDEIVRLSLDWLLREQGRLDEAEQAWQEGIINGERDAPRYLAELLQDQGRFEEAERMLRDGIAAGHGLASYHLTEFLKAMGRTDEAERLRRHGLDIDGTIAGPGEEPGFARP
jgi:tetratricopeptide (TPR) repeat protein